MVLLVAVVLCSVVLVVRLEVLVPMVGGSTRSVHVRWVENDTVKARVFVGKLASVDAVLQVRLRQPVCVLRYVSPEHSLSVCGVRHLTPWWNVECEDLRKQRGIVTLMCGDNQIVCSLPSGRFASFSPEPLHQDQTRRCCRYVFCDFFDA